MGRRRPQGRLRLCSRGRGVGFKNTYERERERERDELREIGGGREGQRERERERDIERCSSDSAYLLQGCGADVQLLHGARLHRAAHRVTLVTPQLPMLEDQWVLLLLGQCVPLKTSNNNE